MFSLLVFTESFLLHMMAVGGIASLKNRKGKNMATIFTNQASMSFNGTTVRSNVAVGSIEGVLSVAKQAIAQEYSVGDKLTYIVSIRNNSSAAADALTVTDDLGAYTFETGTVQPLTYIEGSVQYYRDGELQPAPAVSTVGGVAFSDISVQANGSVLLIYEATVNEFAPLGADDAITNTAVVTGTGVCDVEASETVAAASGALISIFKSVTPVPVAENSELTYTFRIENSGSTALTAEDAAVITDTFNPILSDLSVTLNGEALTEGTGYTYDAATGEFNTVQGVVTVPEATFTQDPATGAWSVTPGAATLIVSGTVGTVCDITPAP